MPFRDVTFRALKASWEYACAETVWYGGLAGAVWFAFYVLFRERARPRKINPRLPTRGQIGWEIGHSVASMMVFGLTAGAIVLANWAGYRTRIYGDIGRHGVAYYYASIVLAVVTHDAYFYWTHRLMHHPRLFHRVHRTHHRSTNPTPWAAYSFSLPEAAVQAGVGPLVLYTIPMHYSAFLIFMTWQIIFNVFGHCGFEIFPKWFLRTRMGGFLNTPTHHALHHEKVSANYGLYFSYWDRWAGTNHPDYARRFVAATGGEAGSETPVAAEIA